MYGLGFGVGDSASQLGTNKKGAYWATLYEEDCTPDARPHDLFLYEQVATLNRKPYKNVEGVATEGLKLCRVARGFQHGGFGLHPAQR